MGQEDTSDLMTMRTRIQKALKSEEKEGTSEVRLATLRLIQCALNDRDVCARERGAGAGCPNAELLSTLEIMVAQREVSAREYDESGRIEEAIREREEIEVIEEFLPKPLSGDALERAIAETLTDLGATKLKDLGRCMSALKQRYPGMIDTSQAGKAVKTALSR